MAESVDPATYINVVKGLLAKNFTKITIINKSFQTVGASAQDHIAQAWTFSPEPGPDGKKAPDISVNENQELMDDWAAKAKDGKFFFYKRKWNIFGRNNNKEKLHCRAAKRNPKDNNILLLREVGNIWFIAAGKMKGALDQKKKPKHFKDWDEAIKAMEGVLDDNGFEIDD